jgi:hypothetical protein
LYSIILDHCINEEVLLHEAKEIYERLKICEKIIKGGLSDDPQL